MTVYANHPIFVLSDELTRALAELQPTMATYMGIPGNDHRWEDLSLAGHAHRAATFQGFRDRLARLDPGADPWLKLARRTLDEQLEQWVDFHAHGDHLLDLNSIDSPLQMMRMVFDVMDVTTPEGWANVASRLEGLEQSCAGYRQTLSEGIARGHTVSRRQVEAVLQQGRVHAGDRGYFAGLPAAVAAARPGDAALAGRIEDGAMRSRGAINALCTYLENDYLPHAVETDAVGPERYARAAVRHLGMKLDAREAYAWGWEEIRRLEIEIRRVGAQIEPRLAIPALVLTLKHDPARRVASTDEFLRLMSERQAQAMGQLDGAHFAVPPPARHVDVKLAPPGGALGAYYTPASEDFSRPGCVWYQLGEEKCPAMFTEISTAYHEGFPGHHLQVSTQIYQGEKLSRFQRVAAGNTGHAEGWALYAEQLMLELGYLEKPEYVLGMLVEQLVRAYRVVVDIGLHLSLPIPADTEFHPGGTWSYDLMLDALHRRAYLERDHAESEVVRYMGWPAQAIAYKLGQRALLALRDERRQREGASFSLARFHERVLEVGSVGLDLLAELVRA